MVEDRWRHSTFIQMLFPRIDEMQMMLALAAFASQTALVEDDDTSHIANYIRRVYPPELITQISLMSTYLANSFHQTMLANWQMCGMPGMPPGIVPGMQTMQNFPQFPFPPQLPYPQMPGYLSPGRAMPPFTAPFMPGGSIPGMPFGSYGRQENFLHYVLSYTLRFLSRMVSCRIVSVISYYAKSFRHASHCMVLFYIVSTLHCILSSHRNTSDLILPSGEYN